MKIYQKYSQDSVSGIIASTLGNVILDGTFAKVPCLDSVHSYDLKKGLVINKLVGNDQITCILSVNDFGLAVGFSNGKIVIFKGEEQTTFQGHSAPITRLIYDNKSRLISGSKDTKIIIWDLLSETGIVKLQGHKDSITGLKLVQDLLFSSSSDNFIKIWDLNTFSCIENVSTRCAITCLEYVASREYLISGLEDGSLKVWKIDFGILRVKRSHFDGPTPEEIMDKDGNLSRSLQDLGNLERSSKEKIFNMKLVQNWLGVQGSDSIIEFFKIRLDEELEKKIARRKKRNKVDSVELSVTDYIPKIAQLKVSAKAKSFDFEFLERDTAVFRILVHLTNNSLEWHEMTIGKKESETRLLSEISRQGHRSDVRALALAWDDNLYASGSSNSVKIWNTDTQECLNTLDSGYILCLAFLPGNRYVVAGTKTGELELFDLSSGSMIEKVKAHEGAIWSLQVKPEKTGMVTGAQDKKVKFWDFRLLEENGVKRITLVHTQTLQMTDDVLSVRISQDGKLLAVALLDSTVKIFYTDSLKFFLSLYGHKLPVVSMDISSDGLLIATASSDKSIKIWGLDFGDCHASLRAHQDSVMGVQFIFGTHYLASVSKDKTVKIWDVDSREMIQKLSGHFGEVWCLAIGKYGNFILTGSHDRSIRKWNKTEEQFMLEEAKEEEMEEIYDQMDIDKLDLSESTKEVAPATLKTFETLKSGDKILQVLELAQEEISTLEIYEKQKHSNPTLHPPSRDPLFASLGKPDMNTSAIVLHVIKRVKPSQLEEALLTIPFNQISNLLNHLRIWLEHSWNLLLCSKILQFILKTHFNQLTSTRSCRPTLFEIQKLLKSSLTQSKDIIGYNMASLGFLSSELSNSSKF